MSSVLTGANGGNYDVHLYFVNSVYGYFLKPFYTLFPGVGWYYIFEIVEVFASFVAIAYVLLSRLKLKFGGAISVLLLSCLAPTFYFESSFTINAALLTAAGFLLIALGDATKKKFLLAGIIFAFWGFVMRGDAFYLGLPCVGMLLLGRWICVKKFPWLNIAAVLCCLFITFCAKQFDRSLYQDEEYKYYAAYQGPRSALGDGKAYDYDGAMDEVVESGLHGADFELLCSWGYYDTQILTRDSLYKFIKVTDRNRHDIVLSKMPFAVVKELSKSLHETRTWIWILLCLVSAYSISRKYRLMPWLSLGYVCAAYVYLLFLNRVVSHVETSIWLYATIAMIPYLNEDDLRRIHLSKGLKKVLAFSCVALFAIGYWGVPGDTKARWIQEEPDARWEAFMKYEQSHPEKIFFFDFPAYKRFASNLDKGYKALPPGRLDRIIPLGYWNVHLPGIKRSLEKLGIENPMRSMTRPDVEVVQYFEPKLFIDFLNTHYAKEFSYRNPDWSWVPGKEFTSFYVRKYFEAEITDE